MTTKPQTKGHTMNKHTPGPWKINWGAYQDGETKANARLIAAAPELLEELRKSYDAICDVLRPLSTAEIKECWQYAELDAARTSARAAIAKATGGERE